MTDSSVLITAAELAELPSSPVILDVRWSLAGPPGIEDYRAGHIPGAVFADLDRDPPRLPAWAAVIRCRPPPISRRPCAAWA